MKPKSYRKSEILAVAETACDLLEEGEEEKFLEKIEVLL